MNNKKNEFITGGGCSSKLSPEILDNILSLLPSKKRDDIVIGFDTKDDGAVIDVGNNIGIIQTLDFFPPIVQDPYIFGQIAAANSMSDVYAMGGEVVCAMNILTYPESGCRSSLEMILKGGADKLIEGGGTIVGGHSIEDKTIKYGLSVTGSVPLDKVWRNNTPQSGDVLILTKKLGVTLVSNGFNLGINSKEEMDAVINSMTKLNKYSRDILINYPINSATDITGFGFLGHLSEMTNSKHTAIVYSDKVPSFDGALKAAREFILTKSGQSNSRFLDDKVEYQINDFAIKELLNDPQTSGGLLISVPKEVLSDIESHFEEDDIPYWVVGEIHKRYDKDVIVV